MVNKKGSLQGEGYDFYDAVQLPFLAAGGAEVQYLVGTAANLAILGSWPTRETALLVPHARTAVVPFDAQSTLFIATQPCFIRLINGLLIDQQVLGVLPAGDPVQIPIPAGVWMNLPDKWVILVVVGQGAAPGVLTIKASG